MPIKTSKSNTRITRKPDKLNSSKTFKGFSSVLMLSQCMGISVKVRETKQKTTQSDLSERRSRDRSDGMRYVESC